MYFSARGETKLDLAKYYMSVGDGIVRALRERPCMLHRFPKGVDGEKVHQKRLPKGAPPWVETVNVYFPRFGRTADELCVTELGSVIWAVQMSTVEFHPWNSRRADVEQPDEWRIDLDPMPEAGFDAVRRVARRRARGARRDRRDRLAEDLGRQRAAHLRPDRAAVGLRRGPARRRSRSPARSSAGSPTTRRPTWWRKDRDPRKVFVDYNQNARDHTIASAYSVRGNPRGTVSTPISWDELDDVDPREFTIATVPARFAAIGDPHAGIDDAVFSLEPLLEWAARET